MTTPTETTILNADRQLACTRIRRNRIGRAICKLMSECSDWEGTAARLLEDLKRLHPNDRRLAAQTPGGLGQHLSKLQAVLSNAACVQVETERVGHNRTRMIYLTVLDPKVCADVAAGSIKPAGSAGDADEDHADSDEIKRTLSMVIKSVVR